MAGRTNTKSPTAPVADANALLHGMVPSGLESIRMGAHSMVPLVVGGGRTGWPLAGLYRGIVCHRGDSARDVVGTMVFAVYLESRLVWAASMRSRGPAAAAFEDMRTVPVVANSAILWRMSR